MKIGIPVSTGKTTLTINQAYVDYVHESGYDPVLITPKNDIQSAAKYCDGLLLPGGIDLDPVFYDEDNVGSHGVDPVKDDFERNCLFTFIGVGKPVFGICRGFQLIIREALRLNIVDNSMMTYWQHINGHRNVNDYGTGRDVPTHSVIANINQLYGAEEKDHKNVYINSIHHQAVIMRVPKKEDFLQPVGNFIPLALTKRGVPPKTKGYLVEAFEIYNWGDSIVRAVQWHPEELKDIRLLTTFFDGAKNKKIKKVEVNVKAEVAPPKVENNNKSN